ncbi:MAG: hypothetical protein PF485_13790 [Bacteroidales bacterium]|jgi:hypothetical protein|nr:hypothetical protein [Bacteroidales bacterium]
MELEYDYWTGTEKQVVNCLNSSIGQYNRRYKLVKIGITNNLEKRKTEHYIDSINWDFMVIKCRTISVQFMTEIKETLDDSNHNFIPDEKVNRSKAGNCKQYLYVLLKELK